jgi:hypothetical protein
MKPHRRWQDAVIETERLRDLQPGWCEDHPTPADGTIDAALDCLRSLQADPDCPPPDQVCLFPDGHVHFFWADDWGVHDLLEVLGPGRGELMRTWPDGNRPPLFRAVTWSGGGRAVIWEADA